MGNFIWEKTKQLSIIEILLYTFIPSGIAFLGFHLIVPLMVKNGIPSLIAWPVIASVMLFLFVVFALCLLLKESRELKISIWERLCLKKLTAKQWIISLLIFIISFVLISLSQNIIPPLLNLIHFKIPDYMPFFLNPGINPASTDVSVLAPNLVLKGNYILLLLMSITILLNIMTEEFYFRAWMMPKLSKYKKYSWVINGTLFALYHTFQLWLFPTLILSSLSIALIVYLTKSIWPAIAAHLLVNFLLSIIGIIFLIIK